MFSYFDLARLFSVNGPIGDIVQIHGEASKGFGFTLGGWAHTLTPYARLEGYLPTREEIGKGLYTHIGLRHNWQVTPWLSFDHSLETFYDTGVAGFKPVLMGVYQAAVNWKLAKHISLGLPQVKLSTPLMFLGKEDSRQGQAAFGTSLTFDF